MMIPTPRMVDMAMMAERGIAAVLLFTPVDGEA
jgi:hypothetical protein